MTSSHSTDTRVKITEIRSILNLRSRCRSGHPRVIIDSPRHELPNNSVWIFVRNGPCSYVLVLCTVEEGVANTWSCPHEAGKALHLLDTKEMATGLLCRCSIRPWQASWLNFISDCRWLKLIPCFRTFYTSPFSFTSKWFVIYIIA